MPEKLRVTPSVHLSETLPRFEGFETFLLVLEPWLIQEVRNIAPL